MRAIGRYQKAVDLDPKLAIARLLHAALVTLELGPEPAKPLVDKLAATLGDQPAVRAVEALHWAVEPKDSELSERLRLGDRDRRELPVPLRSIPHAVDARLAGDAKRDRAVKSLAAALEAAATPSMATWVGMLAIDFGDAELARKAALKAVAHSALYPRARALAARVAMLSARLDEASRAVQELDPRTAEVAVVRAASAYETLDLAELEAAVAALGSAGNGAALALGAAPAIAMGREYPDEAALERMTSSRVPWGALIALDAALDQGKIELAEKFVKNLGDSATTPVFELRRARLFRYQGKNQEAVAASAAALSSTATPRALIERVYALLAAENLEEARNTLAKYPAVLGPMTEWLSALIDATSGKPKRAKALITRLELPDEEFPLVHRVMVARSLAAAGDLRGRALVGDLLRAVRGHPDVVAAAKAIGVR